MEGLLAEIKALRSSSDKDTGGLNDTIRELAYRLSESNRQMENLNQLVSHLNNIISYKDELLANLSRENKNLKDESTFKSRLNIFITYYWKKGWLQNISKKFSLGSSELMTNICSKRDSFRNLTDENAHQCVKITYN